MTTTIAKSSDGSLPIGRPSLPEPQSAPGKVLWAEFSPPRPLPLPNTSSFSALVGRYESDPVKAEYLAKARKSLAQSLYANEQNTICSLRLATGLSQAKLASLAGTTQPYIARIESAQTDPSTDMVSRIAAALLVDDVEVFRAIRNQLGKS